MVEATASDYGLLAGKAGIAKSANYPVLSAPLFHQPAMMRVSMAGQSGIEFMPRHFCRGGRCDP
jgi:hypothetical protein